jgi:hypothetical protein
VLCRSNFRLGAPEDQWTNKAINMTMGIGMPSIKSKIERMFDKPLNQFEFSSDLLFEPNSTLAHFGKPRIELWRHTKR